MLRMTTKHVNTKPATRDHQVKFHMTEETCYISKCLQENSQVWSVILQSQTLCVHVTWWRRLSPQEVVKVMIYHFEKLI